jgi:transaldolase
VERSAEDSGEAVHAHGQRPAALEMLESLMKHPLTDIGLKKFLDDWNKSGAKI